MTNNHEAVDCEHNYQQIRRLGAQKVNRGRDGTENFAKASG